MKAASGFILFTNVKVVFIDQKLLKMGNKFEIN